MYSLHGDIGRAKTATKIKVYEDKQKNQIKIYELMPSIFFSSNEFSIEIPWNGETDIVWQGKYNQQVMVNPQYLSLSISEFKNGQYHNVVDVFDMNGVDMIQRLYDDATEFSVDKLNVPFDEEQYDNYLIILLPPTSGSYNFWGNDDNLHEEPMDNRIFLYQEDGQYYFYKQGQHLKKTTTKDISEIFNYIKQNAIDQ